MHKLGDGKYPFHKAAFEWNMEGVRKFVGDGRDVNERDSHHYTVLHHAVWNVTPPVCSSRVDELIGIIASAEPKPDFNARGNLNETPLHIAAGCDNYYAVLCLLEYEEVDLNATNLYGRTPLNLADEYKAEHGYCRSIGILEGKNAKRRMPSGALI